MRPDRIEIRPIYFFDELHYLKRGIYFSLDCNLDILVILLRHRLLRTQLPAWIESPFTQLNWIAYHFLIIFLTFCNLLVFWLLFFLLPVILLPLFDVLLLIVLGLILHLLLKQLLLLLIVIFLLSNQKLIIGEEKLEVSSQHPLAQKTRNHRSSSELNCHLLLQSEHGILIQTQRFLILLSFKPIRHLPYY
jgi:hypothetical protein